MDRRDEPTVTVGATSPAPLSDEPPLERGSRLGRYLLLEVLGVGGMSVVYSAYDPKLDRRVAIKVMRTSLWNEHGCYRALREAQALAKLAHPNVVAVYDVGTLGDQLFVAMELVQGETLADWLSMPPGRSLSRREILDVMIQAGRGLAAVHQAGLVHRDVKPSNIMVDRTGRARLMDFGVVAAARERTTERVPPPIAPTTPTAPSAPGVAVEAATSFDSAIVGTPSYMAPEQRHGIAEVRSDQYSFCVTLLEALTGVRPAPSTVSEVSNEGVGEGARPERGLRLLQERGGRLPSRLRAVLARGLSRDPSQRYPSMEALLAALARAASNRWRPAVAAVAATAGLAALIMSGRGSTARPTCGDPSSLLAGVWDEPLRAQVRSALARSGRSYSAETQVRLESALDRRVTEWTALRLEACRATRERHELPAEVLAQRLQCLDHQLWELRALTTLFSTRIGGEVVDNAVQSVWALAPASRCMAPGTLGGQAALPMAPLARAQVVELHGELARGGALLRAGQAREALSVVLAAERRTHEVDYPPLVAAARLRLGEVYAALGDGANAEDSFAEALALAGELGDDELLAKAAPALVLTIGYARARPAEALAVSRVVHALLARTGGEPTAHSALLSAEGVTLWAAGRHEEARARFEQVVAFESQLGGNELQLASASNTLGLVLKDLGRHREAEGMLSKAQAIWERVLGPSHPDVGRALNNQGELALAQRDWARARRSYERALEVFEGALGPEHKYVQVVVHNLGELDVREGQYASGLARCERAARLAKRTVDGDHPLVAYHAGCRAKALLGLGRAGEALEAATLAMQIAARATIDAAEIAEMRFVLARALWEARGNRERARALAREAAAALAQAGARKDELRAEVERWLEARAVR